MDSCGSDGYGRILRPGRPAGPVSGSCCTWGIRAKRGDDDGWTAEGAGHGEGSRNPSGRTAALIKRPRPAKKPSPPQSLGQRRARDQFPDSRQYRRTYPRPTAPNGASITHSDSRVRRLQASSSDMNAPLAPAASPLQPSDVPLSSLATPPAGGQSISLQAALYGAITSNPDLVTLRQGNALAASAEAVEVARHFPTALNPTLWIDYRPITLVPNGTFGATSPGGRASRHQLRLLSLRPELYLHFASSTVELGHQTTHRYHIAEAAFDQQKWVVVQAELTALVQTYRFYQTAAYRREKYRLSRELADFNDRLSDSLQKRMEANQVQAADVALARVESRATRQLVKAARQDYLTALDRLAQPDRNPRTGGSGRAAWRVYSATVYSSGRRAGHGPGGASEPPGHPRRQCSGRWYLFCRQTGERRPYPDTGHWSSIRDGRGGSAIYRACIDQPVADLEQRQTPGAPA